MISGSVVSFEFFLGLIGQLNVEKVELEWSFSQINFDMSMLWVSIFENKEVIIDCV